MSPAGGPDEAPAVVPSPVVPSPAVPAPAVPSPQAEPSAGDGVDGLAHRLASALSILADVVAVLDPGTLSGRDAAGVYATLARFERLAVAGKALCAPRVEVSGVWRDDGHASAPVMLAALEGVSPGQAKGTLELGRRLEHLPGTEGALRKGRLSPPKAAEVAGAAALDPPSEQVLLDGAEDEPLHQVRERCRRARATAAGHDARATLCRIRAARTFSSWTDAEGAFCFQGRDTPDRGARILDRLGRQADRIRRQAHRAGVHEPERATRADAFYALLTGETTPTGDGATPTTATPTTPTGDGATPTSGPSGPAGPAPLGILDRPPTCSVVVRVDLEALRRGHARPGELCEIDGQGPVDVAMARMLANDSLLRLVFHEAGDIAAVAHFGRTVNARLRTALVARDRTCVVPGCGVSWGLEIDHVVPFAEGGPTSLENLALLCHHHHFLKTFEGWVLTRTGGDGTGRARAGPRWSFEPPAPFGQEPDLGLDRDDARATWDHLHGSVPEAAPAGLFDPQAGAR